jgi:hypothetical protein
MVVFSRANPIEGEGRLYRSDEPCLRFSCFPQIDII